MVDMRVVWKDLKLAGLSVAKWGTMLAERREQWMVGMKADLLVKL